MSFKPTKEQQAIVKGSQELRLLKVSACAGSGKTSTLTLVANANPVSSLYLAFNKAMALDAAEKFPDYVDCKTIHSMAFAKFGRQMMHKLSRPKGGYINVAGTSAEVARYYRMTDVTDDNGSPGISKVALGLLVRRTVAIFESSDRESISKADVPFGEVLKACRDTTLDRRELADITLRYAKRLWKDRIDLHSPVLITHDTYLKLYQLSKPTLHFKIIYLDEAQDVSDVMLDILLRQDCRIILVGDSRQAIYGWRGAVNAMEKVECPEFKLTQSFRYGQKIADVATALINGDMQIQGFDKVDSIVGEVDYSKPYTIIFRTNSALLLQAVDLIEAGVAVSAEVDSKDFIKLLDSAKALYDGNMKAVKHDSVVPYSDWKEMVKAAEEEQELKRVIKVISSGECGTYINALRSLESRNADAHVVLTTGHKSKGRQFEQVELWGDFPNPAEKGISTEEYNLLYVAATRAIKVLQVNSSVVSICEQYEARY